MLDQFSYDVIAITVQLFYMNLIKKNYNFFLTALYCYIILVFLY